MSWRTVVISRGAKLDYNMGFLVVRNDITSRIHLSEISILLVESTGVSLTTSLLSELTKNKIKVIFCDEKRNPSSELVSYYGSHDTSSKIKSQIAWNQNAKNAVWTEIIREKINQQMELLDFLHKYDERDILRNYTQELKIADETNREGHAAKVYFNALWGKDFSRSQDNYINAALNYGYSIILSAVNREIVSNGYITQIGLFHDNMFNQFNLGSDIMEPFRPIIDRTVYYMKHDDFTHEDKMHIVNVLNHTVIIDGKSQYIGNAIKIYTRSVFDAINDNDISLLKFYEYEL